MRKQDNWVPRGRRTLNDEARAIEGKCNRVGDDISGGWLAGYRLATQSVRWHRGIVGDRYWSRTSNGSIRMDPKSNSPRRSRLIVFQMPVIRFTKVSCMEF